MKTTTGKFFIFVIVLKNYRIFAYKINIFQIKYQFA